MTPIRTTTITAIQLRMGRWILVLPVAHNWAWCGSRFVEHREGVSREAQVTTFASEAEALEYAHEHIIYKPKKEKAN